MRINKQSKNKTRCTRREFLATTAVAASAVAPNASAERSDRDSSADENSTLERVSLAGRAVVIARVAFTIVFTTCF